jgi:transcriptional regulator with XRE-family HTH domain
LGIEIFIIFDNVIYMGLISSRLKMQRIKEGLKQRELAELAKISIPTITRLENGKTNASIEDAGRIAAALNTSVAYLTGETDEPGPAQSRHPVEENTPDEPVIDWPEDDDPLRVASMRLLKGMTPDQLRKAYEYLRDQKQLGEFLKEKGA